MRRATVVIVAVLHIITDFYPRSPCGERRGVSARLLVPSWISIHALLAESDYLINTYHRIFGISIHALLAESDRLPTALRTPHHNFYPRSPCGERPAPRAGLTCGGGNFYPRSPCGERPGQNLVNGVRLVISIHALLAESDNLCVCVIELIKHFYPRSPCGERRPFAMSSSGRGYFYPRSPCGERRTRNQPSKPKRLFLSTLSLRRATLFFGRYAAESRYFYPRSPCGERLIPAMGRLQARLFLSTLSLRRATAGVSTHCETVPDFYPRSPCGERRVNEDRYGQQF